MMALARNGQTYRPGYHILKPNGTFCAKGHSKVFDSEDVAKFDSMTKMVLNLQPILRAFEIAELSHREVHSSIREVSKKLSRMSEAQLSPVSIVYDAHVLMLHRIMAFLSSSRAFLDHTTTILTRLHGEDSSELDNFKVHTNRLFDANFAYKFLYSLRNMSQHVTLPISVFRFNVERVDAISEPTYSTSIILDRAKLLSAWSNWPSLVKTGLQQQPEQFDIMPMLDEQIGWLRELACSCFAIQADKIRECQEYFRVLFSIIEPPPGAVPVLWVGEATDDPNTSPSRAETPPFEDIRRITGIMGWSEA